MLTRLHKYYRTEFSTSFKSERRENHEEADERCSFAEKNFEPLYYIRSYPSDKSKIEMSFDLTNYQPQVGFFIYHIGSVANISCVVQRRAARWQGAIIIWLV